MDEVSLVFPGDDGERGGGRGGGRLAVGGRRHSVAPAAFGEEQASVDTGVVGGPVVKAVHG